mgnify:CR=1 FL=1
MNKYHIGQEIYKEVAIRLKREIGNKLCFSGYISNGNWELSISCIQHADGDITPVWYDFSYDDSYDNDFTFEEVRKLM